MRAESPETIQGIVAELERIKDTARDYVVPAGSLVLGHDDDRLAMYVNHGGVAGTAAYGINPVAHSQIAFKTDIPGKYYKRMQATAPDLLAANVNRWLRDDARSFLLRTIDGNVRAMLGNGYRPMDSGDLFWSSYDVIKEVGAQIVRMDLSETRFYMRALHPEYEERIEHVRSAPRGTTNVGGFDDDRVIPGVVLSTSDVGLGSLRAELFIYRRVCGNGMLGDDVFTRIHTGERLPVGILSRPTIEKMNEVVWMQVQDAVRAAFDPERFHRMVVELGKSTEKSLGDEPAAAVEAVASHYGITDERKQRILNELITGGEGSTVFGLIQAITAVGREERNYDDGVALERVGGRLLTEADRVLVRVRK